MNDLFVHELQDIYYAEQQIVGALPQMISNATAPQLRTAFDSHLQETRNHVRRLEHDAKRRRLSRGRRDHQREANEVAGDVADKNILDAALIACAQAVEHYEISKYGTLIAWANQLGRNDCAQILQQMLAEEKAADEKSSSIVAEGQINRQAA